MKAQVSTTRDGAVVELGFVGVVDGRAGVLEDPMNEIRQYLMADQSGCEPRTLKDRGIFGREVTAAHGEHYLFELWRTFRDDGLRVDLVSDDGRHLGPRQLEPQPAPDWTSIIIAPHGFLGTCHGWDVEPTYLADVDAARNWIRAVVLDELNIEYVHDAVVDKYTRDAVSRLFPHGRCVLPTGSELEMDAKFGSGLYLHDAIVLAAAGVTVFDEQDLYDVIRFDLESSIARVGSHAFARIAETVAMDAERVLFGVLEGGGGFAAYRVPGPLILELELDRRRCAVRDRLTSTTVDM